LAVYCAEIYGDTLDAATTWRINRIRLAQAFGWTLDYVDSLSLRDLADAIGVLDGQQQIKRHYERAAQPAGSSAR